MILCQHHREAIALLAANELDADSRPELERHLATCQGCSEHHQALRRLCTQLSRVTAELPSAQPSTAFHERLKARVRGDHAPRRERPLAAWLHEWITLPRLALAAAAAVLLFALLIRMGTEGTGPARPIASSPDGASPVRIEADPTPAPTLMALSRALDESIDALDALLARQESLLAANDPPITALDTALRPQ